MAIVFADPMAYLAATVILVPFWLLWWRSVQWGRPPAQLRQLDPDELLHRDADSAGYAAVPPRRGGASHAARAARPDISQQPPVERSRRTGPNPWADLPDSAPFVAAADAVHIRRYPGPAASLQLDLLPSPFVGKPDARVFLLLLNPGGRHDDSGYGEAFVQERRRALRFESSRCFWPLAPDMVGTEAHKYAAGRLKALLDAVGEERVAQGLMWLQYFGYQSREWRPFPVRLPSQRFAFGLLRDAMDADKIVIIGRSRRLWTDAVPELARYDYIELRNPRSPYLTPNNMGGAAFDRVVEALML
jgi:hypothetical protein